MNHLLLIFSARDKFADSTVRATRKSLVVLLKMSFQSYLTIKNRHKMRQLILARDESTNLTFLNWLHLIFSLSFFFRWYNQILKLVHFSVNFFPASKTLNSDYFIIHLIVKFITSKWKFLELRIQTLYIPIQARLVIFRAVFFVVNIVSYNIFFSFFNPHSVNI